MKVSFHVPGTSRLPDRTVGIRVTEGTGLAGVCVAVAAIVAATTDIGGNADLSYYATVAQVIPVFLLALMVDIRSRLGQSFDVARASIEAREGELRTLLTLEQQVANRVPDEDLEDTRRMLRDFEHSVSALRADFEQYVPLARRVVRSYVIVAIPGEMASIAALAAGDGSTFAFSLAALSLTAIILLWLRSLGAHFKLDGLAAAPADRA